MPNKVVQLARYGVVSRYTFGDEATKKMSRLGSTTVNPLKFEFIILGFSTKLALGLWDLGLIS